MADDSSPETIDPRKVAGFTKLVLDDHTRVCGGDVEWFICECNCSKQVYCERCDKILLVMSAPIEQRCEAAEIALREFELDHYPLKPL